RRTVLRLKRFPTKRSNTASHCDPCPGKIRCDVVRIRRFCPGNWTSDGRRMRQGPATQTEACPHQVRSEAGGVPQVWLAMKTEASTPRVTPLPCPPWLPESVWPFPASGLEAGGGTIAVTDVGQGPVLLFVHTGTWSFIWRDLLARLS